MTAAEHLTNSPKDHRINIAVTQDTYRAICEHAWRRRTSIAGVVREALDGAGLTMMPGATHDDDADGPSHRPDDNTLVNALADDGGAR